jgi:16S rRNA (guanine527-N7)-methyltransferase
VTEQPGGNLRSHLLARAADLALSLSPSEAERIERYLLLLERWNRTINLTSLLLAGFPEGSLARLVWEPLLAARHIPADPAIWFDLGSGGGSPAIPLKIVRPALRLTMVEAGERKSAFLREAVRELDLSSAVVRTARLEALVQDAAGGPDQADLVTMRAVRVDATVATAVYSLLKPGGRFIVFGGKAGPLRGLAPPLELQLPAPGGRLAVWTRNPPSE